MKFSDHLQAFDKQAELFVEAYMGSWYERISELSVIVIDRLQTQLEPKVTSTIRKRTSGTHRFVSDWLSASEREHYGDVIRFMYCNVENPQVFMTHILNHFNTNGFGVIWTTTEPTKLTITWTVNDVKHITVNL